MEVNPIAVREALLGILKSEFPTYESEAPGEVESLIAKKLLKSFFNILTDFAAEEDTEFYEEDRDSQGSSFSQELMKDDLGCEIIPEETDGCSIDRKIEILKLIQQHPAWKLETIQRHGGKEFKYSHYKKRWKSHVESGGTRSEMFTFIDNYVYAKFTEARKCFRTVRSRNLRQWALQAFQTFKEPYFIFKASGTWLTNWKSRRGISSRKITSLVSRRQVRSFESIEAARKEFQADLLSTAESFDPASILNTDQVGFVYEIIPKRTLTHKGEKSTLAVAKSPKNLVTHSYTVQYTISMGGKIVGDVYLCLQEKTGRLGPQVTANLFPAPNVAVTCSTSGKLTSTLVECYLDQVVLKSVKEDFVLVIDSWGGQINKEMYDNRFGVNGTPSCTLKIIPEKCTDTCQPLDTTFHLQLRYFVNAIYAEANLRDPECIHPQDEVTARNNVIRQDPLHHS